MAIAAIAIVSVTGASARSSSGEISGAGATFPAPLIAVWQQSYEAAKGVKVNYNAIGSGGGIAAITQKTVDFGASDAPLTPDQFAACNGCVQLPWVLSATSVMYNMPLANNLHMTGPVLADIYLGKIKNWNDPRIKSINPGVSISRPGHHGRLPQRRQRHELQLHLVPEHGQQAVEVRRRSRHDGQLADRRRGSRKLGRLGRRLPHDGRDRLRGHRIRPQEPPQVLLDAEPGRPVQASGPGRDQSRLARRPEVQPDERAVDRQSSAGKKFRKAYPICTYSYVLLRIQSDKASLLKPFVTWALTSGQQYGPPLVFQPIPPYVVARGKATLKKIHS